MACLPLSLNSLVSTDYIFLDLSTNNGQSFDYSPKLAFEPDYVIIENIRYISSAVNTINTANTWVFTSDLFGMDNKQFGCIFWQSDSVTAGPITSNTDDVRLRDIHKLGGNVKGATFTCQAFAANIITLPASPAKPLPSNGTGTSLTDNLTVTLKFIKL